MDEYDVNSITIPDWPPLHQLEDQSWQRTWKIQRSQQQTIDADFTQIQEELSQDGIKVSIARVGEEIHVQVTTIRWGWDDELIVYSYKLLDILNQKIVGITAIQNQQKELWIPHLRK
ncbi:MAG: hypothetical protein IPK52_20625 [Chloroflexi bacterium]|nr:hypothetical protein [Chloroflexota bacterium]